MMVYPHPRFTLEAAHAALDEGRRVLFAVAEAFGYDAPSLSLNRFTVEDGGVLVFEARLRGLKYIYEDRVVNNPTYGYDSLVDGSVKRILRKLSFGADPADELPLLKLYWCVEPEHEEDWFVVARDVRHARRFLAEGEPIPIEAQRVATLPPHMQKVDDEVFNDCAQLASYGAGWPTAEAIRAARGEFIREISPRAVAFGDRIFVEGSIDLRSLHSAASPDPSPPPVAPRVRN